MPKYFFTTLFSNKDGPAGPRNLSAPPPIPAPAHPILIAACERFEMMHLQRKVVEDHESCYIIKQRGTNRTDGAPNETLGTVSHLSNGVYDGQVERRKLVSASTGNHFVGWVTYQRLPLR
jgi:hypothetical protein